MSDDCEQEFNDWLAAMDKLFVVEYGLSYQDFPDWGWRDAYEDGLNPEEAVQSYKEEMDGEW